MYEMNVRLIGAEQYPDTIIHPSALLKQMQYAAGAHCDSFGLPYHKLLEMGVVFVMTSVTLRLDAPIYETDELFLQTWEREIRGPYFIRFFRILRDGKEVAAATTNWVLMNVETRSFVRPSVLGELKTQEEAIEGGVPFKKPSRLEFSSRGTRPVRYSDLDQNGHLNNTIYSDIAVDFSPVPLAGKRISLLHIDYRKECRLGDTLELSATPTEEGFAVRGMVEETHTFDAYFTLSE